MDGSVDSDLETCGICGTQRPRSDMVLAPAGNPVTGNGELWCKPEFRETCVSAPQKSWDWVGSGRSPADVDYWG